MITNEIIDSISYSGQYCAGGKIEKNEVGGVCGAHGGEKKCA